MNRPGGKEEQNQRKLKAQKGEILGSKGEQIFALSGKNN